MAAATLSVAIGGIVPATANAAGIYTRTVINANDSGAGSLRAAFDDVNVNAVGKDEYHIKFNIPMSPQTQVPSIQLSSALPAHAQPTATKVFTRATPSPVRAGWNSTAPTRDRLRWTGCGSKRATRR